MATSGELKAMAGVVGAEDLASYRRHGFLLLRGVVPETCLQLGLKLCERWADFNVRRWHALGLLSRDYAEYDLWHKYMHAYRDAGWPDHRRNPNHHLINEDMYAIMRSPAFIEAAMQILGTTEISVHGIFNARPQLPDRSWDGLLTAKWHQDGQFRFQDYGEGEPDLDASKHVITLWYPLQDVDESSGCLQVFSTEETGNKLFDVYRHDYERTGTVGLAPNESAKFTPIALPMKRGDLLILGQRTPHAAVPMTAQRARWSVDVRYEATAARTAHGKKFGFIANSVDDPASVTPVEEWLTKRVPPSP
jgi:hypothetical protein